MTKEDVFATTLTWYYKSYFTKSYIQKFLSDAVRKTLKISSLIDIQKEASLQQSIEILDEREGNKVSDIEAYLRK